MRALSLLLSVPSLLFIYLFFRLSARIQPSIAKEPVLQVPPLHPFLKFGSERKRERKKGRKRGGERRGNGGAGSDGCRIGLVEQIFRLSSRHCSSDPGSKSFSQDLFNVEILHARANEFCNLNMLFWIFAVCALSE